MKAVMMLTTGGASALAMVRRLREGLPDADWTAFVGDEHRDLLLPALAGCTVRGDKPRGSKARFLKDLRAQRFEVAFVAWHGGERIQPLKLAALACGATDLFAIDETGRMFLVRWWAPWTWAEHALRRLGHAQALRLLRWGSALYRRTFGLLVRMLVLAPALLRTRRLSNRGI